MYGKFTGIDFSGKRVHVCTIKSGFREQKIERFFSLDTGNDNSQRSKVIRENISDISAQLGDISTNFPEKPLSIRVIKFPFSDPKKIDKVYKFELENVSTFDPEEKLHSYHLVKLEKGAEILVCMYDKQHIGDFLESLQSEKIDPRSVTFSPLAFSTLNDDLPEQRPLLLVDAGIDEMSFSLFDENGLRRVRSSGGIPATLADAIDSDKEISVEGLKNDLEEFVEELKKTAHFFESEFRKRIEVFVLTGDLCRINGIEAFIKNSLDREVQRIYIDSIGRKNSPFYAKSYALARYIGLNGNGLNLRIGEFAYAGKTNQFKKIFLVPGVLMMVFLALIFYKTASDYYTVKSNVDNLQKQIRSEVKTTFPNVGSIPDPVKFMQGELGKIEEKLQLIEEVKGSSTPLDVLRDLSLSIPDNVDLKLDEVRFESGKKLKVWARCNSYKDIAALEKTLSDSGRFENVSREQVSRAVNNTIKFVLALVLK